MKQFIFLLIAFSPLAVFSQGFDLSGGEMGVGLGIAVAVQKAVENGNYAFVAVIALMFGLQALKIVLGSRSTSIRRNAAQYSAIGGASIGAAMSSVTGGDPMEGAVGGLMVGNAASGLYSMTKPIGGALKKYLRDR